MDDRNFVVILSDIHIGNGAETVWYQKEIHEKYLIAILNDIIIQADQIREVILLGDIFEFWTYPSDVKPPVFDEIIDANPNILGPYGKLRQVVRALKGRTIFIPGEHDMCVTQSDLNKLKSEDGYVIKKQTGPYIPIYNKKLRFLHGHEFTLLSAPCFKSKLAPIPIGYFIHRAVSDKMQQKIKRIPGLTAASMEEYETHNLFGFFAKQLRLLNPHEEKMDFVSKLVDTVANVAKISKDKYIRINQHDSVTLNEVKKIYKYLNDDMFELLVQNNNSHRNIMMSEMAGVSIDDLPWYLKYNSKENSRNIIIMGHNHCPLIQSDEKGIEYVNTGFMCPSVLNLITNPITYGVFNLSSQKMQLMNASSSNNPIKIQPYKHPFMIRNNRTKEKAVSDPTTQIEIKQNVETPLKQKFDFGWSVFNSSLEFWKEMQDGVLAKAKELEIQVLSHDEKSNSVEMIVGSIDLIRRGVNALIIAPFNPELMPVIVEEAQRFKIPVIAIDIGTGGAAVAAFIVSDSFGGGVFAGEYALTLIKKYDIKSKNIAIIKVQKTAPYALLRGEGFKSVMLAKDYIVVAEPTANSEEIQGYTAMKEILNTYKDDLAVVFCENGTMTLGAAKAIDEVGKKGVIMLIGFDSTPSVLAGIKNGSIQGTIGQQPFKMGEIGVETANSILLGMPVTFDDWGKRIILMEVFLVDESGEIKGEVI